MKKTEATIKTLEATKLIGKKINMSFAEDKTMELWQAFMPVKKAIKNIVGDELYSVEVYGSADFFKHFSPVQKFEKWAAARINNFDFIPKGMESLTIPSGEYAVFVYQGKSSEAQAFYQYIFSEWIPSSGYELDDRPHLALMGEKYKNDSPDSEEEIWIPIKKQSKLNKFL